MQEEFDIEKEIENVKAMILELNGRLKFLLAIKDGGYKIVKGNTPNENKETQ